ncbi:MAG: extracellular solute-binding protein [Jatrophihabitans sp.]
MTGVAGCSAKHDASTGQSEGTGPVAVAAADPSGSTSKLVARWNAGHPGERVTLTVLPADEDARHAMLLQRLATPAPDYDVVELRTSDTAEFAAQGWLSPLTGRYQISTAGLLAPAVAAASYRGELYAAPLDVDAGLLYYRSDLLSTPPTTWAQLRADCAIAHRLSIGCYAGQYARGDDLAANTLEAIGSAGGQVLRPDGEPADLNAAGVRNGLQFLADSYRNGVIPPAAITYRASQTSRAFGSGSLLFMRNWATAYATIAASPVKANVRMALLPGSAGPGRPALDGHSLGLTTAARHRGTALAFMNYLQSSDVQTGRLASAQLAPVLAASYHDQALAAKYPVLAVLGQSLRQAQPAPVSQFYPSISDAISEAGYATIGGTRSVPAAISQLQQEITAAAR